MNAIGYVRCAVRDRTGNALDKQVQEITSYCQKNGLQLIRVFKDNGASGTDFNRTGWNRLKHYLHKNKQKIQTLIVPALDRIGRDVIKTPEEIAFLEREYKVRIHSLKHDLPLGKLEQLFKPSQNTPSRRRGNRKPLM